MILDQGDQVLQRFIGWLVWSNQIPDQLIGVRSTNSKEYGLLLSSNSHIVCNEAGLDTSFPKGGADSGLSGLLIIGCV